MSQPYARSLPPGEPTWDIQMTRLTRALGPHIEAFAAVLARRFQAIGIESRTQVRPTPRGLSTFLALVGQRGLICIVDITLVDGSAVGLGPCAVLNIRLLDACGDVVEASLAAGVESCRFDGRSDPAAAAETLLPESLDRAATAVYVATLGHFDLQRPLARLG
jgi:hypothetical protein